MLQAAVTFASVVLAAATAYLAALAGWRRQQRREVYGAFVAAMDDVLESLDLLLAGPAAIRVRDHAEWESFRGARHKFDIAWGQIRLVAPAPLAEHARNTGFALLSFERTAGDLHVSEAQELRQKSPFLDWNHAEAFVTAARKDLGVESGIRIAWLRRIATRGITKTSQDTGADKGLHATARPHYQIPAPPGS